MQLKQLCDFCNEYLKVDDFNDYCPNGLQVEANPVVEHIACGVTASLALIEAAISGNPKFFLGSDSAPHGRQLKENDCGCAGIYSAPAAIELYAEVFDEHNALHMLEGFASFYGADFYGLARNQAKLSLVRSDWQLPASFPFDDDIVVPIRAQDTVHWRLVEDSEKA
jgi:dihydroorotase